MRRDDPRTRILIYLLLTFAFSSYFYVQGHRHGLTTPIVLGIMWCPGVAAIVTSLLTRRSLREIGWGIGKVKYQLAAWVTPMLYAWPAYILVWMTGLGGFPAAKAVDVISTATAPGRCFDGRDIDCGIRGNSDRGSRVRLRRGAGRGDRLAWIAGA